MALQFQAIKCQPAEKTSGGVDKSLSERKRERLLEEDHRQSRKTREKRTRLSIDSNPSERPEIHNGSLFIKVSNRQVY